MPSKRSSMQPIIHDFIEKLSKDVNYVTRVIKIVELFDLFLKHFTKPITPITFKRLMTIYVQTSTYLKSTFVRKDDKSGYEHCYYFIQKSNNITFSPSREPRVVPKSKSIYREPTGTPSHKPREIPNPQSIHQTSKDPSQTSSTTTSPVQVDVIIQEEDDSYSQSRHACDPSTLSRAAHDGLVPIDLTHTFNNETITPPPHPFSLEAQQYIQTANHLQFNANPRIDYRPISQSKSTPNIINNLHSLLSIPLEMKWNIVGQATRYGYERLSTKNKQILINAILKYECYHQGYSRKMGSIPSFIRWYTLLLNKNNGADNKQLVINMYADKRGNCTVPYTRMLQQSFPGLLHQLFRYAGNTFGYDANTLILISCMNDKAHSQYSTCEVRGSLRLTKYTFDASRKIKVSLESLK